MERRAECRVHKKQRERENEEKKPTKQVEKEYRQITRVGSSVFIPLFSFSEYLAVWVTDLVRHVSYLLSGPLCLPLSKIWLRIRLKLTLEWRKDSDNRQTSAAMNRLFVSFRQLQSIFSRAKIIHKIRSSSSTLISSTCLSFKEINRTMQTYHH